jgi:hypothetical protein
MQMKGREMDTAKELKGELQRVYLAFKPQMRYDERLKLEQKAYRLTQQIQALATEVR